MTLTIGEQLTMDRLRFERRLFVKRLLLLLAELGACILNLMAR